MRSLLIFFLASVSFAHDDPTGDESHTHVPRSTPVSPTDPPVIKLVLTPPTPDDDPFVPTPAEPTPATPPNSFAVSTFAPITPPRPAPTIKPVTLVVGEVVNNPGGSMTEESNEMENSTDPSIGIPIVIELPSVVTNATGGEGSASTGDNGVNATFTIEVPSGTEPPEGTEVPGETPVVTGGPDSIETTDPEVTEVDSPETPTDSEGPTDESRGPDSTETPDDTEAIRETPDATTDEGSPMTPDVPEEQLSPNATEAPVSMETPTTAGEPESPESPLVSGAPNATDDAANATSTTETPLENSTATTTMDPMCASHPECQALEGSCCPTVSPDAALFLSCCGTGPVQETCTDNPECSALELEGSCCPTASGVYLDCCAVVPDECGNNGECVIESALEYKALLDKQAEEDASTAADTSGVFTIGMASTALLLLVLGLCM